MNSPASPSPPASSWRSKRKSPFERLIPTAIVDPSVLDLDLHLAGAVAGLLGEGRQLLRLGRADRDRRLAGAVRRRRLRADRDLRALDRVGVADRELHR